MRQILFAIGLALFLAQPALAATCGDCSSSAISCPDGYYVSGWNGSTFNCSSLPNCGSDKVLQGVKNGKAICVDVGGGVDVSCGSGKVLQGVKNGKAVCVVVNGGDGMTCITNSSGWGTEKTLACPSGYTRTGGSCDMHRGDDGREIQARYCQPSDNGYHCEEGNTGTCRVHIVCCK